MTLPPANRRVPWWAAALAGLCLSCGADRTSKADASAEGTTAGENRAVASGAASPAASTSATGAAMASNPASTPASSAHGAPASGVPAVAAASMPGDAPTTLDAFARGRALYNHQCALCHGDHGQGYVADHANALANPEFLAVASSGFLREAIINGRPGTVMAALGVAQQGPLSDADVDAIVAYIESWRTAPAAPVHGQVYVGDPARAEPVYAAQCQQCHGVRGQNGQYASIANPRFLATASDGYLAYTIRHGRPGTPMAAFGEDRLDPRALADMVSLIRSWAEAVEVPAAPDFVADPVRDVINPAGKRPQLKRREDRFVASADVKAAIDAGKRVMILDARARADYLAGHIAGSISIPFFELGGIIEKLPRDTWIIAYCGCPHAVSGRAFDALKAAKFEHIAVLDEGYFFWRDHDFGVAVGPPPRD